MFIFHNGILRETESDISRIVVVTSHRNCGDLSDLEILIILLEDRRFFQHRGIDAFAVVREILKMFTLQKYGGASTIDMQFVRMRTGYKDRTVMRKVYEMFLARLLQSRMKKLEILKAYLQQMYLGSGIYGIESGARAMFGKSTGELCREQAAVIAAMMVYPRPLDPSSGWNERIMRRATYGLKLFDRLGQRYKRHASTCR